MTHHAETHLYTFAVALTQFDAIKPSNLEGVRLKALAHGFTEGDILAVNIDPQTYIKTGRYNGEAAYRHELGATPNHHDGTTRPTWEQLPDYAKRSWCGAFVRLDQNGGRSQ